MQVLEYLISADRIVIAGLAAFDQATDNALAQLGKRLRKLGHNDSEINEVLEPERQQHRESRNRLHRELWTKALAMIAEACPEPSER